MRETIRPVRRNVLYKAHLHRKLPTLTMESDLNLWGIFAMPVGLLLCFWPALLAWLSAERASKTTTEPTPKR